MLVGTYLLPCTPARSVSPFSLLHTLSTTRSTCAPVHQPIESESLPPAILLLLASHLKLPPATYHLSLPSTAQHITSAPVESKAARLLLPVPLPRVLVKVSSGINSFRLFQTFLTFMRQHSTTQIHFLQSSPKPRLLLVPFLHITLCK